MTFAQAMLALPPRQRELFRVLEDYGGWATPVDVGGSNGSHHSKTLRTLAAKGLVDAEWRSVDGTTPAPTYVRGRPGGGSWLYRTRETLAPAATGTIKERYPTRRTA